MLRVNTTIMHNAVVTKLPKAKTGVHMYTATLTKEMSPQSVKLSISNQINEMYSNSTIYMNVVIF